MRDATEQSDGRSSNQKQKTLHVVSNFALRGGASVTLDPILTTDGLIAFQGSLYPFGA